MTESGRCRKKDQVFKFNTLFSSKLYLCSLPVGKEAGDTHLHLAPLYHPDLTNQIIYIYYHKRISIENVSFYVKIVLTYNSIEVPIYLLGSPSTINRRSLPGVGYTVSFDMYNLSIDFYQLINLLFD